MAKVIYNDIVPLKGIKLMTIWPFIFTRKGTDVTKDDMNHECIHLRQQIEVLIVSAATIVILCLTADVSWWWMASAPLCYFVLYGLEYAVRLFAYGNRKEAYRNISFEQEAFANEKDAEYLGRRRRFAWVSFLTRKTYRRAVG